MCQYVRPCVSLACFVSCRNNGLIRWKSSSTHCFRSRACVCDIVNAPSECTFVVCAGVEILLSALSTEDNKHINHAYFDERAKTQLREGYISHLNNAQTHFATQHDWVENEREEKIHSAVAACNVPQQNQTRSGFPLPRRQKQPESESSRMETWK